MINDIAEDIIHNHLTDADKESIIETSTDELYLLNGYASWIRELYKLWHHKWEPDIVDGIDISPEHPDNMSYEILKRVQEKLKRPSEGFKVVGKIVRHTNGMVEFAELDQHPYIDTAISIDTVYTKSSDPRTFDDICVDHFATKMKDKLELSAKKGRGGWWTADPDVLQSQLIEHIKKGDFVDVANYCMFIDYIRNH